MPSYNLYKRLYCEEFKVIFFFLIIFIESMRKTKGSDLFEFILSAFIKKFIVNELVKFYTLILKVNIISINNK